MIYLSICVLVLLAVKLFCDFSKVQATLLLFVEIHVFYIVANIVFTDLPYDAQTQLFLKKTQLFFFAKLLVLVVGCFCFVFIFFYFADSLFHGLSVFLFCTVDVFYKSSAYTLSTSTSLLIFNMLLTVCAFEFCILNFFMFFAVLLFSLLQQSSTKNTMQRVNSSLRFFKNFNLLTCDFVRGQKQLAQLLVQGAIKNVINKFTNSASVAKVVTKL